MRDNFFIISTISNKNDSRWKPYIFDLNKMKKTTHFRGSDIDNAYGVINGVGDVSSKETFISKGAKEITLDEYFTSELPEKWCIKIDRTKKEIADWFNKNKQNDFPDFNFFDIGYLHYPGFPSNAYTNRVNHCATNVVEGYKEISFDQFKQLVLEENMESKQKLKREGLKEIYDVACSSWKDKLEGYGVRDVFKDEVELTDTEVTEMYKAANAAQKQILDKWLKEPIKHYQMFKENAVNKIYNLFNGGVNLLENATPNGRSGLKGNALYVTSSYHIEIGDTREGGQFIYISPKTK